jgi:hypothetical protein
MGGGKMTVLNVRVSDVKPLDTHAPYVNPKNNWRNYPAKKMDRREESSLRFLKFREFNFSDNKNVIGLSNDVWISDTGKTSVGCKTLGSKWIGQKSPIVGDDSILDRHGHFVGRIFDVQERNFFDTRRY